MAFPGCVSMISSRGKPSFSSIVVPKRTCRAKAWSWIAINRYERRRAARLSVEKQLHDSIRPFWAFGSALAVFQRKADLRRHLTLTDRAIRAVPADFRDLKPTERAGLPSALSGPVIAAKRLLDLPAPEGSTSLRPTRAHLIYRAPGCR
jgi:hypothetical protein